MATAIVFIPLTQGEVAVIDFDDMERIGRFKWCVFKTGRRKYAVRRPSATSFVYMHREVLALQKGQIGVDHRNGDGLDNRKENLRQATHVQNMRGHRRRAASYLSPFRGVTKNRKRWSAKIWIGGRLGGAIQLGTFDTQEEAARAYDNAAIQYGFEMEALNFPQEVKYGPPEI